MEGLIGRPEIARNSPVHQLIFMNGRPVQDRRLSGAIRSAYGPAISRGSYPFFVVFLDVDPTFVDVNVHPTKREVRFSDESLIYGTLVSAVRSALSSEMVVPEMSVPGEGDGLKGELVSERRDVTADMGRGSGLSDQLRLELKVGNTTGNSRPSSKPKIADSGEGTEEAQISLWQLHNRYIMAQIKNGLIIVDQHVAHERIIYEEAMENLSGRPGAAQQLLFPITLELTPQEISILEEVEPLLEQIGFGIRRFSGNAVIVDAVPAGIREWGNGEMLRNIIDEVMTTGEISPTLKEKVAMAYACHAAIKSGERLSPSEMQVLIDRLFATKQPFICPHGRPIVIKMSLEEIDRRFGR